MFKQIYLQNTGIREYRPISRGGAEQSFNEVGKNRWQFRILKSVYKVIG